MNPLLLKLLPLVLPFVSNVLKETLKEVLPKLKEAADGTPNHFDNVLVSILYHALGVDEAKPE
jgi:hypothetical protein